MKRTFQSIKNRSRIFLSELLKSQNLQSELDEIKKVWEALEFVVKPYKDSFFVLSDLEDLQLELDDMMTNINNILGNRYVAKLQEEAAKLFRDLTLFSDIFDQWKDCQRNWLYLENIFRFR